MNNKRRVFQKPKPLSTPVKVKKAKDTINSILNDAHETKSRMIWFMTIALAESECIDITTDELISIIDDVHKNADEYEAIVHKDGREIADEKLNRRINQIVHRDEMADTPDKLYRGAQDADQQKG